MAIRTPSLSSESLGLRRTMECLMKSKKRKTTFSETRRTAKLERELKAIEAQIVLLEKDTRLDLAVQDHFVLWRRPNLFAPWPLGLQH